MFVLTDDDASAIRAALEQGGELSAAAEMRRRFPGVSLQWARSWVGSMAGWTPPDERAGEPDERPAN